jgi:hypothetical protein
MIGCKTLLSWNPRLRNKELSTKYLILYHLLDCIEISGWISHSFLGMPDISKPETSLLHTQAVDPAGHGGPFPGQVGDAPPQSWLYIITKDRIFPPPKTHHPFPLHWSLLSQQFIRKSSIPHIQVKSSTSPSFCSTTVKFSTLLQSSLKTNVKESVLLIWRKLMVKLNKFYLINQNIRNLGVWILHNNISRRYQDGILNKSLLSNQPLRTFHLGSLPQKFLPHIWDVNLTFSSIGTVNRNLSTFLDNLYLKPNIPSFSPREDVENFSPSITQELALEISAVLVVEIFHF